MKLFRFITAPSINIPIVQASAPYLSAGCCAVIELVSNALYIKSLPHKMY